MMTAILTVLLICYELGPAESFEACEYHGIHLICEDGYYCCQEHNKCCSYFDDIFGEDTFKINYYPIFVAIAMFVAIYKFTTKRHTSIYVRTSRRAPLDYTRHFNQNPADCPRKRQSTSDTTENEDGERPDTYVSNMDTSGTDVRDNRNEPAELQSVHIE